jgi:hypothetical protein
VEILAAVQEQAPGLPPVDVARLGALRTLAQIVDALGALLPVGSTPAPAPAAPAPAVPVSTQEAARAGLGRYVLDLVPAPALELGRPGLRGAAEVVVTPEGGPIAPALVQELRSRGIAAHLAASVPDTAEAVIFLGGLGEPASPEAAMAVNHDAFAAARAVAAGFTRRQRGLFVTVQDTGGGFGLTACAPLRALLAGLPALVKTARQEWPGATVAAIDLERAGRSPERLASVLADELLAGGPELEVGLAADGERRTLRSRAVPLAPGGDLPVGPADVVLVSGGARGVTACCVLEWARRTGARFVLLGRSRPEPEPPCCAGIQDDAGLKRALLEQARAAGRALTPMQLSRQVEAVLAGREIQATLQAIAQTRAQARYLSIDVQDPAGLASALAAVRQEWGPVTALVHGAGVLTDKRIADLDDAGFQRVFATKVAGLRALLEATAADPLRRICLFASVSARCGNNGQAAYAMANEVLNKMAQAEARRRGPAVLVKSLGWGPWEGGMVHPLLKARFTELGVPMIPLGVGALMFADEMAGGDPGRVELVLGGEPRPEALLMAGGAARAQELEVHLDARSHGFLADHRIAGAVVVPLALVVEWFCRAALAFRPGLRLQELRDLRVLRGIKLEAFPDGGRTYTVRCAQIGDTELELELLGPGGTLHYRARADLAAQPRAPLAAPPGLAGLGPWGDARIYGDVLFHGPAFQVIEAVDGVGAEGIQGRVHGVLDTAWPQTGWQTDPLVLDSALQLSMLWARQQFGAAVLPMGLGSLRLADQPLCHGPERVVARCRRVNGAKVLVDAELLDPAGRLLGALRDVELVLRPDGTAQEAVHG